jgi:cytochrome o ubiquinol oxidase subunit 2
VLEAQSAHFVRVALLAMVAILPALIALPLVLWRYRFGGSGRYRPRWEFNKWYEMTIWTGPVLVVCVLGYWLAQSTFRLDPYKPLPGGEPVRIDLVGLSDTYLVLYPDQGVAALGEIVIPVDRPVAFRLTTDDVMQSFLPNGFAGQIYAMPGMITQLHLVANREGEGVGTQMQFNGAGFAHMRVPMRAVSATAFDDWVASRAGDALDPPLYSRLAAGGVEAEPRPLPLADTCLFDRVVARYHQGTPVSALAQPGSPRYDPARSTLPATACATLVAMDATHPGPSHAGHAPAATTE